MHFPMIFSTVHITYDTITFLNDIQQDLNIKVCILKTAVSDDDTFCLFFSLKVCARLYRSLRYHSILELMSRTIHYGLL